jgi:hypothetical protein
MSPRDQAALRFAVEDIDPEAARKAALEACIAAVHAGGWVRPAPAPRTPEAELRVQIGMAWLSAQRRPL